MQLVQNRVVNPNLGVSCFPQKNWSSYEYLLHYQSDGEHIHAHEVVIYVPPPFQVC